jgi:hypothetical protein
MGFIILLVIALFTFKKDETSAQFDTEETETIKPTISIAKGVNLGNQIYQLLKGFSIGTEAQNKVLSLFDGLNHADYKRVYDGFGTHFFDFPGSSLLGAKDLTFWINSEFDQNGLNKMKELFPDIY